MFRWTLPSPCGRVFRSGSWVIRPAATSGTATRSAGATRPNGPTTTPWFWPAPPCFTGTHLKHSSEADLFIEEQWSSESEPGPGSTSLLSWSPTVDVNRSGLCFQVLSLPVHPLPAHHPEEHGGPAGQLRGHLDELPGLCGHQAAPH